MSKLVINGITIFSTNDSTLRPTSVTPVVASAEPSFATHRLIDGNWVPKGSASVSAPSVPTFVEPSRPIGFQPSVPAVTKGTTVVSFLGSRKEYLRAIEIAAGKTLLAGVNTKAIEAIRRGRLGGRKDNMGELHALLVEYSV